MVDVRVLAALEEVAVWVGAVRVEVCGGDGVDEGREGSVSVFAFLAVFERAEAVFLGDLLGDPDPPAAEEEAVFVEGECFADA